MAKKPAEPTPLHYCVRWMIQRDLPDVLAIETESFEFPWAKSDFLSCLRQRNSIGMVMEYRDQVQGLMVYELQKTRLELLNLAVRKDRRRTGVGAAAIAKLIGKLSEERRRQIRAHVRENNLPAQLFFRAMGFRATRVHGGYYQDTTEDAIEFEYDVRKPCAKLQAKFNTDRWTPAAPPE